MNLNGPKNIIKIKKMSSVRSSSASSVSRDIDYSDDSSDLGECPWLQPVLQNAEVSTCFKKPQDVTDGRGLDFSKPASPLVERDLILGQTRTRDAVLEITKKCNFKYIPGVLFNRKISEY